jgi:hypothetical protein
MHVVRKDIEQLQFLLIVTIDCGGGRKRTFVLLPLALSTLERLVALYLVHRVLVGKELCGCRGEGGRGRGHSATVQAAPKIYAPIFHVGFSVQR